MRWIPLLHPLLSVVDPWPTAPTSRVRERAPRRKLNPTKVFMGGVPKDCELSVLQAKFPGIVDGSVRNQVAFVDFDTPENAEAAVAMHDQAVRCAAPPGTACFFVFVF